MEFQELNVQSRTSTGKGTARTLRRDGRMPAVLYGPDTDPALLSVQTYDLEKILKKSAGGQVLVSLIGAGSGKRVAMLKELQSDPLSGALLHADFYEVAMDRKIRVRVPVVTTGKSKGVEFGGLLQTIRRELEILSLPGEIPDCIELDITDLDVNEAIHVADIKPEGNIEIPYDVNFTVVTILSPKIEAAEETDEDEEGLEEIDEEAAEQAE